MADYKARRRDHRDRGRLSPGDNNGEADSLDSSGTPSKLDISGESRVAARRRERERAAAASDSAGDGDESRGASGGSSSRKAKDKKGTDSAKGGRFAHRKMREKRRGTGVVVLEDDDTANATASVKATTDYNEEVTKKADAEADHHGNGTTNSYETPTQRRQATPIRDDESANGSGDSSRIRARRRQGRESLDTPLNTGSPSSPRSILRREVEGRTAEEWKRDLKTVDEELDRSREDNRALNKAMSNLRS
ncbi:uncharacterized protein LOC117291627 isoform X2 [Asterias rubens]|uniref:uncharacterized protein LOC117291627 isoform X2 n=1 Tax=Asterias rubens TaxID=7604 RepID=UPI001455B7BC|nr:uncharacterized protein LOC117291627 isoform X2 [Asterias rubens]